MSGVRSPVSPEIALMTLLPPFLPGLLALTAKANEPDDQLPLVPHGKSLKLIWHDEFNGDKLVIGCVRT
jgi:hypothetical protein